MKLKNVKTRELRKRGYAVVVAFSLCLIFCLSVVRGGAQKAQKRITSIWTATGAEGSRVTVAADKQLSDYEAYSRGDRFYVKIPLADLPSTTGSLLGRGFDDVQIHRVGDGILLSFRLQPGTTARVEQRLNRVEVVFSIPRQSAGPVRSDVVSGTRARTIRDTAGPTPPASIREYQTGPGSSARHGERGARTTGSARGNNPSAAVEPQRSVAKSSAGNVQKSLREKEGASSLPSSSGASANQSRPTESPAAGKSSVSKDSTAKGSTMSASPQPSSSSSYSPSPRASSSSSLAVASPSGTPPAEPATRQTTAAASPAPISASAGKSNWSSRLHNYKEWVRLNPIPFGIAGLAIVAVLLLMFVRGGRSRRRGAPVNRKERPVMQPAGPVGATTVRTTPKPAEDPDREVFEL